MSSSEPTFLPRVSQPILSQSTGSDGSLPSSDSLQPNGTTPNSTAYDAALLFIPICFVAIWAGIVCVISDTWKMNRKEMNSPQQVAQVPCKKCRFFSNNPYVKCAVNPSVALTKEAMDCSDFRPRDRKLAPGRSRK